MRPAFTLIELLVVVSIIVLLLALLAPALDKAVYQAELAVCGANQKTIASSTLGYAFDQRRHYPYLPGPSDPDGNWQVTMLRYVAQAFSTSHVDVLKYYLPLNRTLNDPLNPNIDIENADIDSFVYTPYTLWFSWCYRGEGQSARGMNRVGDRFTFYNPYLELTNTFDVLVSDLDRVAPSNVTLNSHPDDADRLIEVKWQDHPFFGFEGLGTVKLTLAGWATNDKGQTGDWDRGLTDMNTGFADGSVSRYDKVDDLDEIYDDGRLARVPEYQRHANDVRDNGWWNHLPPAR